MVHDPVMAYEDGTYYLLSTGRGIQWARSADLRTWEVQPESFIGALPAWTRDSVSGFTDHVWAPDLLRMRNRWLLTYSCSTFGRNTSAIGLMTAPRLSGPWTDRGCVVRSESGRDEWNAIDSSLALDDDGRLWMAWGSFWDGIQLAPVDTATYRLLTAPQTVARRHRPGDTTAAENPTSKYAGRNAIEAPFLFRHDGYYYLFVSWDYCCRGAKSNYRVVVGRSRDIEGPYIDREGQPMLFGGGTPVISGDGIRFEAAGHSAAYSFSDGDHFICHGYSNAHGGHSILIDRRIEWTEDGWPKVTL